MPIKKKKEIKESKLNKLKNKKQQQNDEQQNNDKSAKKNKKQQISKNKNNKDKSIPTPITPQPSIKGKGPTKKTIERSKSPQPPPTKRTKLSKPQQSAQKSKQPQSKSKRKTKSTQPKTDKKDQDKKNKDQDSKEKDKNKDKDKDKDDKDNKKDKTDKDKNDKDKDKDNDDQIVKTVTIGGAAVDTGVPQHSNYRVFQDAGKSYSATLNQANLDNNNNKYYIVQVLLNIKTNQIYVFNKWGRIGFPGQQALKGPFNKNDAINEYNKKVREKTIQGDYKQLEIKYDNENQEQSKQQKKIKKVNNIQSKMDQGLQQLISLIFDQTVMNNTMKQIGYNASKMPLGKLGQGTIKQAYTVLNKLSQSIKKGQKDQYSQLSSQFYTLIPHNIGYSKLSQYILDNQQKVKQKLKMLQSISDMKVTVKLLKQSNDQQLSVQDQNYKKLGCSIKTLDKKSKQYLLLSEYFNNTKGYYSRVAVGNIYEIQRPTQTSSFNTKIGNNMLLWHGSGVANFVGILSQGLRIAPPEAPVSGYLFGKGIYLADLAEKSINYCRAHNSGTALMLLIEGALGKPNILKTTSCSAKQEMERNGKDSTKCHGSKAPPESCYVKFKEMVVPNGPPQPTNSGSYMGHNQYIVYNTNQARIRFVIEMNMNG